jgi:hypothetical protein
LEAPQTSPSCSIFRTEDSSSCMLVVSSMRVG